MDETIRITADFRRASYPFWHGRVLSTTDDLYDRERGSSLVLVYDRSREDYRAKIWMAGEWDEPVRIEINGVRSNPVVTKKGDHTFLSCHLSERDCYAMLYPPVDDEDEEENGEGEDYLDACVETVFQPDPRSEHLPWRGDVSDFPAWMDARSIELTPPMTGGGAHLITLHAPGMDAGSVPSVRVNGVWCARFPESDGGPEWNGKHSLWTLPSSLDIIRDYGREDISSLDIELENRPIPPRGIYWIRKIHLALGGSFYSRGGGMKGRGGLAMDDYYAWRKAVKIFSKCYLGISMTWGQIDYYRGSILRCQTRSDHLARIIDRAYSRRAKAYAGYERDEWLAEVGGEPKKWSDEIKRLSGHIAVQSERAARLQTGVDAMLAEYEEGLAVCERYESRYADIITKLFPAR